MPPRITRSKWPCLFPRHDPPLFLHPRSDPLLFLYPRWFTTRTTDTKTQRQDVDREQKKTATEGRSITKDTEERERNDGPPIRRLSVNKCLIRRLDIKRDIRRNAETTRTQLLTRFPDADDWRTPLASLRKHTPSDPRHHVKQLEQLDMPQGLRGYYRGDLHELFVHIYLHTGCHVQVSRYSQVDDTRFDALELAGTRLSINLARNMLNESILVTSDDDLNANKSMGAYKTVTTPLSRQGAEPRSVWVVRSDRHRRLASIHKPSSWNTIKFAGYIEDLVNSDASRPETQRQGQPFTPHVDRVTARLMAVFLDQAFLPFISSHACSVAIQYLASHRKIPQIRDIIQALDGKSILITPQVFNVCLYATAETRDMHNYNFLLHLMLHRNIQPDHDSWAALVSLVQARSPRDTKHIISAMRARGLLANHAAKIAVANAVIRVEFGEWVTRADPMDEFIVHYDRMWGGPEWLDTRCVNIMLGTLVEKGRFADAFALLQILSERGHQPNTVSLNVLLKGAYLHRDIPAAQAALELLLPRYQSLRPNRNTFKQLAILAIRKRAHNLLRVAWRYACMAGQMSWKVHSQMERSLLSTFSSADTSEVQGAGPGTGDDILVHLSRKDYFMAVAGKIAVGVDKRYHAADFAKIKAEVTKGGAESTMTADGETSTPPSTTQTSREQLLKPIHLDLSSATLYHPVLPLEEAFAAAAKIDREWSLKGLRKGLDLDLDWMLENAVVIDVE